MSKINNYKKKLVCIMILFYPLYLFFILDVDVNELNNSKEKILNLFGSEINFNNLNYELRSNICFKNRNHLSTFIWKLVSPYIALFENQFDKDL